jgi:hypothetical protein
MLLHMLLLIDTDHTKGIRRRGLSPQHAAMSALPKPFRIAIMGGPAVGELLIPCVR